MEVSGFTMHLYCDHPDHRKNVGYRPDSCDGEYLHETKRGPTITKARADGWLFKRNRETICPICNQKDKEK